MSGILFRVHTASGERIDVTAADPKDAREKALAQQPGAIVTKIKAVKGN